MFEKLFKTELVVSEKLEEYLNDVIGFIDCGEEKYIGDNLIIYLERDRKINTRNSIVALIQTFSLSNNHLSPNSPTHFRNMFPQGNMDSLDLEILINYSVLGILNSTLNKARNCHHHYREKMLRTAGIKFEMNRNINKRAEFYANRIELLISEREQYIDKLKEASTSSFDFTDSTIISYRKKLKTIGRK